jgi:hypothetical protein
MHQHMVLIMQLYEAIWQSKLGNTDITKVRVSNPLIVNGFAAGRWFANGTLRGFDFDANISGVVKQLRILEQNPNKLDPAGNLKHFANLAKQGHRICWLIERGGPFLGRVHNGEWIFSQPNATRPVQPKQQAATAAGPSNVSQTEMMEATEWDAERLPDIPNDVDIPDFVLNHFADLDEEPPNDLD